MFCPKCGAENTEGNKFCQKCGAALALEAAKPTGLCAKCGTQNDEGTKYCKNCGSMLDVQAGRVTGSTTSLEPNIAGLLCYLAGWITGLVFILIEKENKFVRFHAMQSIVTFGALTVVWIMLQVLTSVISGWFWILGAPIWILSVILWVVLMVKAYQGERFKLPVAGDFAEKNS